MHIGVKFPTPNDRHRVMDNNFITVDFKRESFQWLYGESDVEIGITKDNKLSYISIEIKSGIIDKELKILKKAIGNERTKFNY